MVQTQLVLLMTSIYLVGANTENNKRLLLNDPDVMTQMKLMQTSLQTLTQKVSQLETELANQKMISSSAGSVYIRWGRTTCSGDNTELVYYGYTAGQHHYKYTGRYGGPSSMLCLPNDPEHTNATTQDGNSFIYGAEYEESKLLKSDAINEDAPCAVCRSVNTETSIMIPGRQSCYSGWKNEYSGYLASDHIGHSASSFICLDKDIEYVSGGQQSDNGRRLYLTRAQCGSLECPPYKDGEAVFCVVCSK